MSGFEAAKRSVGKSGGDMVRAAARVAGPYAVALCCSPKAASKLTNVHLH
jgi:hypothetical protein